MESRYLKALTRSDLSEYLVHLIRPVSLLPTGMTQDAAGVVHSIFGTTGWIAPSLSKHVTRYDKEGAACFYDAPPGVWPEIVATNPNGRVALGVVVHKRTFWSLGGRSAIYTDNSDPSAWPPSERFRIIHTDLARGNNPIDWMHEREWRIKGGLSLSMRVDWKWWWPIVPDEQWKDYLFATYPNLQAIYVLSQARTISRSVTG